VEAALVSLHPKDGAITALVGGFDFNRNKFNHVNAGLGGSRIELQAASSSFRRGWKKAIPRPPSSKTPPLSLAAEEAGAPPGTPQNYDGSTSGPVRMTHGADQIAQPGVGPHPARDRSVLRARLYPAFRL